MPFKFSMKFKLCFISVVIMAVSCKSESTQESEIAKINTDVKIERFDRLFDEVNSEGLTDLKTAYPFMFSDKYQDSFWLAKKSDTLQIQLFNEVEKEFANIEHVETDIESLFNHLKFYFSEFNPPRIITTTNDVDYRNRII